ncbi:pH nine-sensitive protein 1 [Friedmanniomyces endolithicus]|uniref:Protein PNS1 n=2 Tax=Dothideomycetidae TaxID=451867 RepID=A0A4U0V5P3_9PEZI|nr:putative choline transporter, neither null mutation nor overexpression affects choline transport [Friedmanniomyces endolithicus]KAK5145406.1 pH nine-sensitive protein 1 [Rachicladosporium monterosium]KAK0803882.1 pH nine-sensitive protein 1 [Friedmanniomyces endolithicus]KAK0857639.1 pH nine-sensitive protein 1 [Friedmanniomyces endolithicus]KAK0885979.1 pH nine-sensitive protein 1 [Friedmanniomyces endolithicus]
MAHRGQAADYYTNIDEQNGQNGSKDYPMQPQQAYGGQQQQYNGQQQQQYGGAQSMPPPPSYQQGFGQWSPDNKPTFEQAFKVEKPKYNDWWAGLLFLAVFAGFVAVSGISLQGYAATKGFNGGGIYGSQNDFGLNTNTMVLFAFCLVMALVLGYGYISMARIFTKQFIWITGILNIIWCLATAIYMLYRKYYSGGIVFLIFGLFTVFCFITWIPRIPFSVLMLQTAIDVSKKFGHVYIVSFLGGLIAAAFGAWFSVTLVAVYVHFEPGANPACNASAGGSGGCSSAKVIGLVVFITFAGYWITEVLKNIIHVTISGVYGAWYFSPNNPPKGATRGALRRALTYSFGSISLGSLVVALINLLRQACSVAQQQNGSTGNFATDCAFCILQCFLGLLDWAVQFINRYAFSYMALYGKSYFESAKATWRLIKDRGIDALVNECLIGPVLTMGATFVAYACALLAYLYLVFTKPSYNTNGEFTPVVVAYAFLIGLQIANCFTVPLSSGIDTIFVAAAWDPEVLMKEHPEMYNRMIEVYPHVQQAIHA